MTQCKRGQDSGYHENTEYPHDRCSPSKVVRTRKQGTIGFLVAVEAGWNITILRIVWLSRNRLIIRFNVHFFVVVVVVVSLVVAATSLWPPTHRKKCEPGFLLVISELYVTVALISSSVSDGRRVTTLVDVAFPMNKHLFSSCGKLWPSRFVYDTEDEVRSSRATSPQSCRPNAQGRLGHAIHYTVHFCTYVTQIARGIPATIST